MSVEELVVQNAVWINKRARQFYSDVHDADDLAGETIYKCLKQAHVFDLRRNFKSWALTIMYNTYISQYNRKKRILFTGYETYEEANSYDCADQHTIVRDLLDVVHKCNRRSCCIECVVLYAKGYNYKEISEKVGVSLDIVRSRIAGGRKLLAKALNR